MDEDLKLKVLSDALKDLFYKKDRFSVIKWEEILEMKGIRPHRDVARTAHLMHCVDYNEMSKDVRDYLFNETMSMCSATVIGPELIDMLLGAGADNGKKMIAGKNSIMKGVQSGI